MIITVYGIRNHHRGLHVRISEKSHIFAVLPYLFIQDFGHFPYLKNLPIDRVGAYLVGMLLTSGLHPTRFHSMTPLRKKVGSDPFLLDFGRCDWKMEFEKRIEVHALLRAQLPQQRICQLVGVPERTVRMRNIKKAVKECSDHKRKQHREHDHRIVDDKFLDGLVVEAIVLYISSCC